jgi:hypothetical protein
MEKTVRKSIMGSEGIPAAPNVDNNTAPPGPLLNPRPSASTFTGPESARQPYKTGALAKLSYEPIALSIVMRLLLFIHYLA